MCPFGGEVFLVVDAFFVIIYGDLMKEYRDSLVKLNWLLFLTQLFQIGVSHARHVEPKGCK